MAIQPNAQNPGSLTGTMETKKATLYDPATNKPTVVDVGSAQASQLQGKGYTLQPKPKAQPGAQPAQPAETSPFALSQVMNAITSKVQSNNTLMSQRNLLLKHLYDQPLTDEEKKQLDPTMLNAVNTNDRNLIDMNLRLVSDEIQGRTSTLDQSVKYLTDAYEQEQTRIDTQKKEAMDNVMKFVTDYGSDAKTAMTSLYGQDYVNKLQQLTGIDLSKAGNLPETLAEKKADKDVWVVNPATGELYNKNTGKTQAQTEAEGTLVSPSGISYDMSTYAADPAQARAVQGYINGMGKFNTITDMANYIHEQQPDSPILADMIANASDDYGVGWEELTALMQHESVLGTSNVAKNNNNPGGITWSKSYQDSHPGATKGTARPAGEGGNYVKFKTMQDGVNAVAEQLGRRKTVGGKQEAKKSDVEEIADAIIKGDQPPTTTGLYGKSAAVKAELARRGFDLTSANLDYTAVQKNIAAMNSTSQVRLRQSIQFVVDSVPLVRELVNKWKSSNYPVLNKAQLTAAKNGLLGPEAQTIATQLDTQINDMAFEMGTAYKGGNSSTDQSLKQAGEQLKSDWSNAQLNANLDLLERNMKIRLGALPVGPIGVTSSYTGSKTVTAPDGTVIEITD